MTRLLQRMWRETDGTLSFEWVTLTGLLTIGAVGGLATVRDAIVDEMADVETFRGYGPEQGYEFLRENIARID